MIESLKAWWAVKILPNFTKAWSWRAAAAALIAAWLPDAILWLVNNFSLIELAFPTLSPFWKLIVLSGGAALVTVLRPIKQESMAPVPVVPQPAVDPAAWTPVHPDATYPPLFVDTLPPADPKAAPRLDPATGDQTKP